MEDLQDSRPIEWIRELFTDADAESMFVWMFTAWAIAAGLMIVSDRLGSILLGRSRPLEQAAPARARTWRWGRKVAPAAFARHTTMTRLAPAPTPPPRAIARPSPVEHAPIVGELPALGPARVDDSTFWKSLADDAAPWFGDENTIRLDSGEPPQRYNPVTGRIETLERHAESGEMSWPRSARTRIVLHDGFGRDNVEDTTRELILDDIGLR